MPMYEVVRYRLRAVRPQRDAPPIRYDILDSRRGAWTLVASFATRSEALAERDRLNAADRAVAEGAADAGALTTRTSSTRCSPASPLRTAASSWSAFPSAAHSVIAGGRTWRGASPADAVRAALAALP